eukprot:scaffold4412_cov401-Prasinococcus_capsulatus_cf.AAC.15
MLGRVTLSFVRRLRASSLEAAQWEPAMSGRRWGRTTCAKQPCLCLLVYLPQTVFNMLGVDSSMDVYSAAHLQADWLRRKETSGNEATGGKGLLACCYSIKVKILD